MSHIAFAVRCLGGASLFALTQLAPAQQTITHTYQYDADGNVTQISDGLNHATVYTYDMLNRRATATDPNNSVTTYGYDGQDRLTSVKDARNLMTSYAIDGLGNLTQTVSPDTGTATKTYDAAGNLLTSTDAKGQTTTYQYDALNRIARIAYSDGATVAYTYDQGTNAIGRLSRIDDASGSIVYAYDMHGRVTSDVRTIGGQSYTTSYWYDSYGRLSGTTYPSGRRIDYVRDGLGRITQMTDTKDGTTQTVVNQVTYQPFGAANAITFGNGRTHTRSYDTTGRLATFTLNGAAQMVSYDAASRITAINDANNAANNITFNFDALDRVTSALKGSNSVGYAYDAVGNRTNQTAGLSVTNYSYDSISNRLTQISGSQTNAIGMDANGSTVNNGPAQFTYDARGRMVSANTAIGLVQYRINGLGQRVPGHGRRNARRPALVRQQGCDRPVVRGRRRRQQRYGRTRPDPDDQRRSRCPIGGVGNGIDSRRRAGAGSRAHAAQLYVVMLDRAPENDGFTNLATTLQNDSSAQGWLNAAQNMYSSAEAQAIYGSLTDTQFINTIYQNTFNRAPTAQESGKWLAELQTTKLSRAQVVLDIINAVVNYSGTDATQLSSQTLLNNKVAVGIAFALQMGGASAADCRSLMNQVTDVGTGMTAAANDVTAEIAAIASGTSVAAARTAADTQAAYSASQDTTATTASSQYLLSDQMYRGTLLRCVDIGAYNNCYSALQGGTTIYQLADNCLNSTECKGQAVYWNANGTALTNSQFVTAVYSHVLMRQPISAELTNWVNSLNGGATRGTVLMQIIVSFTGGTNIGGTTQGIQYLQTRSNFYGTLSSDLQSLNTQEQSYTTNTTTLAAVSAAATQAVKDATAASDLAKAANTPTTTDSQYLTQVMQSLYVAWSVPGASPQPNLPPTLDQLVLYTSYMQNGVTAGQMAQSLLNASQGATAFQNATTTGAFINQLYNTILGRNAQSAEMTQWTNAYNGGESKAQLLVDITNACIAPTIAPTVFADQANKYNFLSKISSAMATAKTNAAAVTLANRMSSDESAALSAAKTADASAVSKMTTASNAYQRVMRLAVMVLNKTPSVASLAAWQSLAATQGDGQVAGAILNSSDAQAIYQNATTNTSFLNTVYGGALGRAPTSAELSKWSADINSYGRGQMIADLAAWYAGYAGSDAATLGSLDLFTNKVSAGLSGAVSSTQANLTAAQAESAAAAAIAGKALVDPVAVAAGIASGVGGSRQAAVLPTVARTFDRWGNVKTQTNALGGVTSSDYNAFNEVTRSVDALNGVTGNDYDQLGRQVASRDADGNLTGRQYDAAGHLLLELHADGGAVAYGYDALGDKLFARAANGAVTSYGVDRLGRLTSQTQAAAGMWAVGVTDYAASLVTDGAGTHVQVAAAGVSETPTQRWTYDALGRTIAHTNALGQTDKTYVDLRGNLLTTVDAAGDTTQYAYDAWNHKNGMQDADGGLMTWSFTGWQQTGHQDLSGANFTYAYNALNALTAAQSTGGTHAAVNLSYTYDLASGLLIRTDDAAAQSDNGTAATQVTQYAYDAAGRRLREKTALVQNGAQTAVLQDNHIAYDLLVTFRHNGARSFRRNGAT